MNEWIPVSDRLPEGRINVILTIDYNGHKYLAMAISEADGVFTDAYDLKEKYDPKGSFKPVAWFPLPEPYTEKINDIVEVVRCKDCKHYYKDDGNVVVYRCELCHEDMRDDFYCADGENR